MAACGEGDAGGGVDGGGAAALIAFNSNRDGADYDLFVVRSDGTNLRRLTRDPGRDIHPAFSPDGTRIAFASTRGGGFGIYTLDVATGTVTPISVELGMATSPSYSPDGLTIAFQGAVTDADRVDVYVVSSTGGRARRLTSSAGRDGAPVWSPDGTLIYFVSDRSGDHEIHVMDADGDGERSLTTRAGVLGRPTLSPDGRTLAFAQRIPGQEIARIATYDLATGETSTLTAQDDYEPAYDRSGGGLVFASGRSGDPDLYILSLDAPGSARPLATSPSIDGSPAFAPSQ